MDKKPVLLLPGLLLMAVAVAWFLRILLCLALLVALGWLSWKYIRRAVPRAYRWVRQCVKGAWKWWWGKLCEDPLEKAQCEAIQEIENSVHFYAEMQQQAAEWADAQEN